MDTQTGLPTLASPKTWRHLMGLSTFRTIQTTGAEKNVIEGLRGLPQKITMEIIPAEQTPTTYRQLPRCPRLGIAATGPATFPPAKELPTETEGETTEHDGWEHNTVTRRVGETNFL
jgi:hypothetical protein